MTDPVAPGTAPAIAFRFASFQHQSLIHGMSGRRPGSPARGDVAFAKDTIFAEIAESRQTFLAELGVADDALTLGRQTHGANVAVVRDEDRGRGRPPDFDGFPETDALITASRAVALGVIVADCTPILLYDPRLHVLGLAHAGWRGTVGQIAARTVATMEREFGSRAADLLAGVGPSIGSCCYEVGDEVIDAWNGAAMSGGERAVIARHPRPHFDLWEANRLSLAAAGVPDSQIELSGVCTRCRGDQFFSHRAFMAGERERGRMIMVAQLAPLED